MTDKEIADRLIDVLRLDNQVGRHWAVPRTALLARLSHLGINISDRTFRRIYTSDDCPACSCDDGLFIPAHWWEVQDYLRYYGSHVRPALLQARARVMTLAYHDLMLRDVGPLFEVETIDAPNCRCTVQPVTEEARP